MESHADSGAVITAGAIRTVFIVATSLVLLAQFIPVAEGARWDLDVRISPTETTSNRTVTFTLTLENTGSLSVTVCRIDIQYDWALDADEVFDGNEQGNYTIAADGTWSQFTEEAIPELEPGSHDAIVTISAMRFPELSCSEDQRPVPIEIVTYVPPVSPPVAHFSFLPLDPTPDEPVQFTDESTDSDGRVVAWKWSFGDGGTSNYQSPIYSFAAPQPYLVELEVTDDDGSKGTFSRTVLVQTNRAPVAGFTYDPVNPTTATLIQFSDGSLDPDGSIVRWRWEFGDGSNSTEQNPQHRYLDPAIYWVTLTVTDDDEETNSVRRSIEVVGAASGSGLTALGLGAMQWGALGVGLVATSLVAFIWVKRKTRPSRQWGQAGSPKTQERRSRWRPR